MQYVLTEKYPAERALERILNDLAGQGWKPLRYDFLDSSRPSSQATGWSFFVDATRKKDYAVQQWHGQWTNSKGDIVAYDLEYRWPWVAEGQRIPDEGLFVPDTDRLQVYGNYIPAELAKRMKAPDQR